MWSIKGRQMPRNPLLYSSEALPEGKWAWMRGAVRPGLSSVTTMSASLLPYSFHSEKKMPLRKRLSGSASEKNLRGQSSINPIIWIQRFMIPIQKVVCLKVLVSKYSLITLNTAHLIFMEHLSFKMESMCYFIN